MNSPWVPDYAYWCQLFLLAAAGSSILIALAGLLERFFRGAIWQRAVWQAAIAALAVLALGQWLGFGPAAVGLFRLALAPAVEDDPGLAEAGPAAMAQDAPAAVAEPVAATAGTTPAGPASGGSSTAARPGLGRDVPAGSISPTANAGPAAGHGVIWPAYLWGLGTALVLLQILRTHWSLLEFRRRHTVAADEDCLRPLYKLAEGLQIRRPVVFLQAPGLRAPVAFGWLRPTLVFPQNVMRELSQASHQSIIAHELAHLASRDPFWQLLADLTCAVWWWQPLAWWTRRRLRSASEAAADEASLLVPGGPDALAACLVDLGRRMTIEDRLGWLGFEGGGFQSGLGRRVERLLHLTAQPRQLPRRRPVAIAKAALWVILVIASVFGTAWASPQAAPEPGETNQSMISRSWHCSLAGMALAGWRGRPFPGAESEGAGLQSPRAPHPPAPLEDSSDLDRRLQHLQSKVHELALDGRNAEADRVRLEMQRVQERVAASPANRGPGDREPPPIADRRRLVGDLLRAAEGLRAGGLEWEAAGLTEAATRVARSVEGPRPRMIPMPSGPQGWPLGPPPGITSPPPHGGPPPDFPPHSPPGSAGGASDPFPPKLGPLVTELRDEMREMQQEVNEIRRQLRHMGEAKTAPPK